MAEQIEALRAIPGESAFFRDDQAAIRAGALHDGFVYDGQPLTPGFTNIREPGVALVLLLRLDDGHVVTGDCVEVQYPGVGGRAGLLEPETAAVGVGAGLADALVGQPAGDFRGLAQLLRTVDLPASVRYGASQALLRAAAHARRRTMTEVVCEDWGLPLPGRPVPVFAQCGNASHEAIDRMILKRVDALPHGLINNVEERLGRRGEILSELVTWLRGRTLELAGNDAYRPVFQFDVYGTIGLAFGTIEAMADYVEALSATAAPFRLRIEHPLDAGGRDAQIEQLAALRNALRARGCATEIIADEWCNTAADIAAFAAADCVDMIQIKTPDLGGLDETVDAALACRRHSVKVYCGGSCNETVGSAQASAHVALACGADLTLAKPGMGMDEGLSLVRNEMRVALAQLQR